MSAPTSAPTRVRRIGYLSASTREDSRFTTDLLVDGLRALGWIEGQNLVIEWRFADGRADLLPELAENLVQKQVEIIVTQATASYAAHKQTSSIPIVGVNMATRSRVG